MMSLEAVDICDKVVAKINRVCVVGMGRDEEVWTSTVPTHDLFWEALKVWDADKTKENRALLTDTAKDWIGAWREASVEYQERNQRGEDHGAGTMQG